MVRLAKVPFTKVRRDFRLVSFPLPRPQIALVPETSGDMRREKFQQIVQCKRNQHQIVNGSHNRNGKIEWCHCIQRQTNRSG
jgi:hypothetical protein